MKQYQHGDVLIQEVKAIPEGCVLVGEDEFTVAYGEHTGHHHVIKGKVQVMERTEPKTLFLNVIWPSTIIHEEHKPIELPVGLYEIGRVKEYDYFEAQARIVRD